MSKAEKASLKAKKAEVHTNVDIITKAPGKGEDKGHAHAEAVDNKDDIKTASGDIPAKEDSTATEFIRAEMKVVAV